MDKEKGKKNIIVSISFKVLLLIGALLVRRFLIKYIGNEINGLSSLYMSIIGFLTVAELGVGEAITYCMYKPIVDGDDEKVAALYNLFKKMYAIIGAVILVAGLILMPFLPRLAKDYSTLNVNVYLTFGLTLVSVVLTYAYSAKTSLINAYKNNYITTSINSISVLFEDVLKIIAIILTHSFVIYLLTRIVAVIAQWIATNTIAKTKYGHIMQINAKVDNESRVQITNNIKAMFMHKIGDVLVNAADSIIISAFIGVVILGKYSNYTTIVVSLIGVLNLFFTPLTSVVGHAVAKESKEQIEKYFNFFYGFNYFIGVVFFLGFHGVINAVIRICFGENLELDQTIVFVITLNYFIQFMRRSILLFRSATGTFYYDRWKPLFEGLTNIVLSIIMVKLCGLSGVIIATIITNLLICDVVEPHVVYKYGLKKKATKYYILNYSYITVFTIAVLILNKFLIVSDSAMKQFIVNGFISLGIACIPLALLFITNRDFREYGFRYLNKIKYKLVH